MMTHHPRFEADQVLTNDHLNLAFEYLEEQNRLTRTRLIGQGIVCGLTMAQHTTMTIMIDKGFGVSSDGYVIELPTNMSYNWFLPYKAQNLPKTVSVEDQTIYTEPSIAKDAFRLVTDAEKATAEFAAAKPLLELIQTGATATMTSFKVVLYLQVQDVHKENCTNDCDEHGVDRRYVVVPLLVPMSNMATDFNRADNVSLSKIRLKRLKGIKDFKTVSQLTAAFDTVNQDNKNTLVFVFNNLFWEPVVRKLGINQRDLTQYRAWINQLKDMTLQSLPRPYMFAFLTDLESAWNEFAEAFACACSDPCFGLPIHEKHLTLGTYPFSSNTSVRHHFLNSASVSSCRHSQERLKLLYERIFALINAARIGENLPFEPKITPSRQTPVALGKRAMPIYYKFDRDFRRKWLASNCPNTDDLTVLSYEQKDSLEFSLAEYDFFRVEGHLGLNVKTAYEKLNTMVNQFNLPFTILTLGLVQEPKKWPWWNVGVINHVDQIYFQIESKKIASDYFQTFKTLTATKNEEKKIVYSGKNLGIDDSVAKSFAANISMVATTNAPTKAFNTQITQLTKLTQDATTLFGKVSSPNVVAGLSTESLKLARDKMIDTNYSRQLSELLDALKERQLKAMLFDKFVERYRGLEPMNGVPRGGTLVLVFSSADENLGDRIIPSGSVVADFALPYYVDQVLTDELTIA